MSSPLSIFGSGSGRVPLLEREVRPIEDPSHSSSKTESDNAIRQPVLNVPPVRRF